MICDKLTIVLKLTQDLLRLLSIVNCKSRKVSVFSGMGVCNLWNDIYYKITKTL